MQLVWELLASSSLTPPREIEPMPNEWAWGNETLNSGYEIWSDDLAWLANRHSMDIWNTSWNPGVGWQHYQVWPNEYFKAPTVTIPPTKPTLDAYAEWYKNYPGEFQTFYPAPRFK